LRWFHNFETLTAILSFSALVLEPSPFLPRVLGVGFVAATRH
jgi:hypothetical protein